MSDNAATNNPKPASAIENEDDYHESEDEDFNPDNVNKDQGSDEDNDGSSDDENGYEDEDKDLDAKYKNLEGVGLIKTRAQRKEEENKEKEYAKSQEKASIDVNALWQELNGPKKVDVNSKVVDTGNAKTNTIHDHTITTAATATRSTPSSIQEEYITIHRTYRFAGKTTTEEKRVLASSAEGKAYLAEQQKSTEPTKPTKPTKSKLKAPKKRKSTLLEELEAGKAKRMNTLEKSRLDWLGFVDQEGIRDDLSRHNKGGYLQKQDFLSRVEHKIDQDIKSALNKK